LRQLGVTVLRTTHGTAPRGGRGGGRWIARRRHRETTGSVWRRGFRAPAAYRVLCADASAARVATAGRRPLDSARTGTTTSAASALRRVRPASGGFTFYGASMPPSVRDRLDELSARYGLPPGAAATFEALLDLVAAEPASITSVRDPREGADVHVADSLVALEVAVVRDATRIADLGSGAGFPGLALAIARPDAHVALVESVARKCVFLERAARALGLANVVVVSARAEAWREGLEANDLVTARALAPLGIVLEYAAPLLMVGGTLVAWKGRPESTEETDAHAAAGVLGMSPPEASRVQPFNSAQGRRLYLSSKVMSTPARFPRREGMARKRPLKASASR
jgi:16S rRNA (guanine527-N7)-methyltransferase